MMRPVLALVLAVAAAGSGCVDNSSPGNDREASLEPAAPAAERMSVQQALDGVSTGLLYPEVMTDADLGSLPDSPGNCVFRFTRVGFPVFVSDSAAGVIKLNGKLIRLPTTGADRYGEGAVDVSFRPLDREERGGAAFTAELVLRLEGAPNELGFHGYAECE